MNMLSKFTLIAATALLMTSCSRPGWSVEGTVEGADKGTGLSLEACNAGRWYVLDSITVGDGGKFSYHSAEPMASADILRLQLPGQGSIYFPVDSIDAIHIETSATTFGIRHTLSGTPMAATVSTIDSIVATTSSIAELQRKLVGMVTSDTTGLVAYYTVGKAFGNKPIFDPNESLGNRIYGAAAQVYAHYHPLDPHGAALRKAYFDGRRALCKSSGTSTEQVIEVPETAIIDITRYDDLGVSHSLKEVAGQGKVVLLSFIDYGMESAPAYNSILNDIYKLYSPKGIEIYQIAFDSNEVTWKEAARNLPWITVWNSPSDGPAPLALYNVGVLPMSFIINNKGELSKRVADPTELPKEVAKYF